MLLSRLSPEDAAAVSAEASSDMPYTDTLRAAEDIYGALLKKRDTADKKVESADELSALLERMKKIKNK